MLDRELRFFTVVVTCSLCAAAAAAPAAGRPDPWSLLARLHRQAATQAQPLIMHAGLRPGPKPAARPPKTFYVNAATGSDGNPGTSPQRPWRTLARADLGRYRGGDRLLLRAGQRFPGTLWFDPSNLTATYLRRPLTIGAYGGGRATIAAETHSGLVARNVAGVRIDNLDVAGRRTNCRAGTYGIFFDARQADRTLAAGITIADVAVHGFCDGITIGADDDASRFAHIRIADVNAHDNGDSGVLTYDQADSAYAIRDVTVTDTRAFRNAGDGGIVLFGVDRGSVERSVAYANGAHNQGGVGIWAFDAKHILLAHDESYGNLTTGSDGDGFDLDGGVSDSVMDYDYSHGNEGVGFLVCPCLPAYRTQNDVVRFDVSVGDGLSRITQPSGIFVDGGGPFSGLQIVSNTAYSAAGRGPLIQINDNYVPFAHIHIRDNVFVAGGAKPLLRVDQTHLADVRFQGNDWWSMNGSFRVRWARLTFTTLAAWRARTGAETRAGRPVGLSADPDLCQLGWDGVLWPHPLAALNAYRPLPGSPALQGRLGALALARRCGAGAKG